jgi:hypothetical protein
MPGRFLLLCLWLLALGAAATLLAPGLELRLEDTRGAYRLWSQGVPLDLLQELPPGQRRQVFQRLHGELRRQSHPGQRRAAAGLWAVVAPCAEGPCPEATRRLEREQQATRRRHQQRFTGSLLLLLGTGLGLLAVGGLALRRGRGTARLALALALLMGLAALGMRARQFALAQRQLEQAAALGRQVVRVRLSLDGPPVRLARELQLARELTSRVDGIPARARVRMDRTLARCAAALSAPDPGSRRSAVSPMAVHCPRVLVPLARARAATLAPLPGSRLQGRVVDWLSLTAGLLLLLAPLFQRFTRH